MKLSIIVPVYNMAAGNKLRFCLDSLVNQTIADYEIIAVGLLRQAESMRRAGIVPEEIMQIW